MPKYLGLFFVAKLPESNYNKANQELYIKNLSKE